MRRMPGIRLGALAIGLLALVAPAAADDEKVVNVYNWSDYITEETLKRFTAETGIKVNYDVYDSNEILETKLMAGNSGYDVVFPSATPYFAKQIKAGALQKLDLSKIPNRARVSPKVLKQLTVADPDNAYGLPYMMAGTGIGYNIDKVKAAMPDAPVGSAAMLFDPKILSPLKDCGITVLDAPEQTIPAALAYIGRDPNTTALADLDAATEVLIQARPYYRYIHSSAYINDLANGAICVAMGFGGDLFQARQRAREAQNGVSIGIFLPKEGAAFIIDVMAIPANAPHLDNAHKFINYMLTPDVIGPISTAVGYANAIPASKPHMAGKVRDDPAANPPDYAKLFTPAVVPFDFERARTRAWTRIKAKRQ